MPFSQRVTIIKGHQMDIEQTHCDFNLYLVTFILSVTLIRHGSKTKDKFNKNVQDTQKQRFI